MTGDVDASLLIGGIANVYNEIEKNTRTTDSTSTVRTTTPPAVASGANRAHVNSPPTTDVKRHVICTTD